jgi:RNA polymerase sigma factor (sigma-70 family)
VGPPCAERCTCPRHHAWQMVQHIKSVSCGEAAPTAALAPAAQPIAVSPNAGVKLESLYREEFPKLVRFLARSAGSDAAGDLAQDVFLRACASRAFSSAQNPAGFLRRIAVNLLIDHLRRRRTTGQFWEFRKNADVSCDAEQEYALLGQDLDWLLTRALGELPSRTRQIFHLNRFEQKSYREIRDELGISMSGVDYHMMKALSRLRAALEENC